MAACRLWLGEALGPDEESGVDWEAPWVGEELAEVGDLGGSSGAPAGECTGGAGFGERLAEVDLTAGGAVSADEGPPQIDESGGAAAVGPAS